MNTKLSITQGENIVFAPDSLSQLPGLSLLKEEFPARSGCGEVLIRFESGRNQIGFTITREDQGFRVSYARPCDGYRGLGLLLAGAPPSVAISQDCAHESVGVMWDLSRNAVLRPESWESLLRKFALLGINSVQLYMEDVYQIPGEPFFGYGRGAYSTEELRRIDDYGHQLGIEVIPCIQTLGHLEQILQWPPYRDCADVPGVLMVGEEKTRRLIGKALDQMAACFRTRTIHVGMDEANGVGTGNYLRKNGYQRPFDTLNQHLRMVAEMCRERGLHPMIWSDMYFRIGSERNDYYDRDAVIPEDVAAQVPPDVELVYWDYYHPDPASYEERIQRHRDMGKEPVFAAGAWSWGRFWAYTPFWRETLAAGMRAARSQKLKKTFLTIWGDDGAEFHPASVLSAVQYFAEWAYVGQPDDNALERQFGVISPGSALNDYLRASQIDEVPAVQGISTFPVDYSRWILWHDPVLGFLNSHITGDLPDYYRGLAQELDRPEMDEAIQFAGKVARAVGHKAELHLKARTAWKAHDLNEIIRLRNELLPECLRAVRDLWQTHYAVWNQWNKPFGWEVIEHRYAGCVARLERLGALLKECQEKKDLIIPEWEFEPIPFHNRPEECYFNYNQVNTPTACK